MGTLYLPFRAATGGAYPYDTYASSLNLEHRWRLNTTLATNGATEASVGTQATNIERLVSGGTLNLVTGVTKQTADSLGHQSTATTASVNLWAAPSGGIPATFTMGIWYTPYVYSAIIQNLFSAGATPTYNGLYHGVYVWTLDGTVVVEFGNGASDRHSYATAAGIVSSANPAFIVLRTPKATSTSGGVPFDLFVNGVEVACPYASGGATSVVWGDRLTFGSGYWGRGDPLREVMDEPFMTSGSLSDAQILQLYNYGVTP